MDDPWYSARGIFRHAPSESSGGKLVYEERVVLFRAESFEDAIRQAEVEAEEYCSHLSGVSYLGYVMVYHLPSPKVAGGTVVFSLLRSSNLPPKAYLKRFFDTGTEFSGELDESEAMPTSRQPRKSKRKRRTGNRTR